MSIRFIVVAGVLTAGVVSCCSTCKTPPDPGAPLRIVDQTPSAPRPSVGTPASVVLVGEGGVGEITWFNASLPRGWSATVSSDTRTWTANGVVPVGGADPGLQISVQARDASGTETDPFEKRLVARPTSFTALLKLHSEIDILKQYEVRLPQLPPWPEGSGGKVVLWVDTQGLAPAGPDDDWIKVWSVEPHPFEVISTIASNGLTKAGHPEPGETITLSSESHRKGLANKEIAISIRCFHGSQIEVNKVEVTVY